MLAYRCKPESLRLDAGGFRRVRDRMKPGERVGINFTFFNRVGRYISNWSPIGALGTREQAWVEQWQPGHYKSLVRRGDGLSIEATPPALTGEVRWVAGAGPVLIHFGEVMPWTDAEERLWTRGGIRPLSACPRVAVGILPDGDAILAAWRAATILGMAHDLKRLGCVHAIAGDGGSSASLVVNGRRHVGGWQYVPSAIVTTEWRPVIVDTPLLRRGSRGEAVIVLQELLQIARFSPGPADGIFGWLTWWAVRRYQAREGLMVDGIVGPQTWGSLKRVVQ